jgi:hypothetical protein
MLAFMVISVASLDVVGGRLDWKSKPEGSTRILAPA